MKAITKGAEPPSLTAERPLRQCRRGHGHDTTHALERLERCPIAQPRLSWAAMHGKRALISTAGLGLIALALLPR